MSSVSIDRTRSGDLLDYYRLEELVAVGGTARVFRATDTRTGNPVAVKIPHVHRANRSLLRKGWNAEADCHQTFQHPGIVRCLPANGANRAYTVMEWVEGRSLRQILEDETKLTVEQAVRIALQICDVLAHIHERGVVHLDLKPDNIMVGPDDRVTLIDIEPASEMKREFWARLRPRRVGTPDYASPEQIRGKPGNARSDIYSLGLILYEMLTGEVPFSGVAPQAALSLRTVCDPLPVREIDPEIPVQLEAIICRALARDPAKRQASVRGLLSELELAGRCTTSELVGSL